MDNKDIVSIAVKALDKGLSALSNFAAKLENTINEIGSYKGEIDTRLHGSSNKTSKGSYWEQIVKDMTDVI